MVVEVGDIVQKKFPIETELLLIDEASGYALKKTKWKEAVIKECEEEANLPEHWFDRMKPAGCVR